MYVVVPACVCVCVWCASSLMPTSEVINVACPSSLIDKARLCEAAFQDNGCERVIKHRADVPQASMPHVPPEIYWGVLWGRGG